LKGGDAEVHAAGLVPGGSMARKSSAKRAA
jgi:hypothetical protein